MLDSLRELFGLIDASADHRARLKADDARLAVAALLVHCMAVDGTVEADEERLLRQVLTDEYGLAGEDLDELIDDATRADREAVDLYRFTSVIRRELDRERRALVVEQLWKMVYADGAVHEFEDNLIWRIAELLGIERYERLARKSAVASEVEDQSSNEPDGN